MAKAIKSVYMFAMFGFASIVLHPLYAADSHDYSSYIKLKEDIKLLETDSVNGVHYPGASAWDNNEPMDADGYYLIPEGRTLGVDNADKKEGYVAWPGQELAIQGTFNISASKNRDRASYIPNLALLPGGVINLKSVYSTLYGNTIDIRGTAAKPAVIKFSSTNKEDKDGYYPKLEVAFTGDPDGVVRITNTGKKNFQRAFRVTGGFAKFYGTVIVDGEGTWLRPETWARTFDVGGTLLVTNRANVYIDKVSPKFSSLVMAEGTTLQIEDEKTVTVGHGDFNDVTIEFSTGSKIVVTDSLSISNPIKLKVNNLFGNAYKTVLITVPVGECELRAEDFIIVTEKPQFRYVLAVDVIDGIQTLWIKNLNPSTKNATTGYVVQKTADGNSANKFTIGSFNQEGNWSDGKAPHSGTNYYTTGMVIRDKDANNSHLIFQGDSLTKGVCSDCHQRLNLR